MPTRNLVDWIALNLLPGLGPIKLGRALERFGDPGEIAYRVPVSALATLRGAGAASLAEIAEARKTLRARAEKELQRADRSSGYVSC